MARMGRPPGSKNKNSSLARDRLNELGFDSIAEQVKLIQEGVECPVCEAKGWLVPKKFFSAIKAMCPVELERSRKKMTCPECVGTKRSTLLPKDKSTAINQLMGYEYPKLAAVKVVEEKNKLVTVTRLHADADSPKLVDMRNEANQRAIEAEAAELLVEGESEADTMREGDDQEPEP